jgi:hypothetical protein
MDKHHCKHSILSACYSLPCISICFVLHHQCLLLLSTCCLASNAGACLAHYPFQQVCLAAKHAQYCTLVLLALRCRVLTAVVTCSNAAGT